MRGRIFRYDAAADEVVEQKEPAKTSGYSGGGWPMTSQGGGVPRHQAGELAAFVAEKRLAGTTVLPNGAVQHDSRGARAEFLKARGIIDNDGGYRETRNSER